MTTPIEPHLPLTPEELSFWRAALDAIQPPKPAT